MKSKKTILLALFMICLSPVIFGWVYYSFYERLALPVSNHGVLVSPPREISFITHENGAWQVMFMPEHCGGKEIDNILLNLESVRKILGENDKRVGLTLLLEKPCHMPLHSFRQFILTRQQLSNSQMKPGQIYLVDPRNNLFMYYPAGVNPMDIFKDLKRVLNVSQIG
jgi:hypothetical protein